MKIKMIIAGLVGIGLAFILNCLLENTSDFYIVFILALIVCGITSRILLFTHPRKGRIVKDIGLYLLLVFLGSIAIDYNLYYSHNSLTSQIIMWAFYVAVGFISAGLWANMTK